MRKHSPLLAAMVIALFALSPFLAVLEPLAVGSPAPSDPAGGTVYWLKLKGTGSSETIYMGFAPNSTNLFNGKDVGEAPNLSRTYGEYDDGASVFDFYTNFTSAEGFAFGLSKGSYSVHDGLRLNFNGPGYAVSSRLFGPGTEFFAYVTHTGDVDNVGYVNTDQPVNSGTGWAGAYVRQACGRTYPDQWNSSGEANGCGSKFGFFADQEGIPGVYGVEVLSATTSVQYLNGNWSGPIDEGYPAYPASVGFTGVYSPLDAQWAFVATSPGGGVPPSVRFSQTVYPVADLKARAPSGISHAVPIEISPSPGGLYDQELTFNSSLYSRYEAPNLQNVEFFYPNGTVIPSWLEELAGSYSLYPVREAAFPRSVFYQPYERVNGTLTLQKETGRGTYGISAGVFNGTVDVQIYLGDELLASKQIAGQPFNYVVSAPSSSYLYVNFNSSGQSLKMVVSRVNGYPLFAYNLYSGRISSSSASLITIPPQFALNLSPYPASATPNNTGMSFLLKAPTYGQPTPLAIWIGEGYSNPKTGKEWWAQIGFNNWAGSWMNVSYAGWGVFSNFLPTVGGTDVNYPLKPGATYNFTMTVLSGDTWEFMVNNTPIGEGNLTGFMNLTAYADSGADLGFETLAAWGGNINVTNPVTVPVAMSFKVGGRWLEQPNLSLDVVGENWWNGMSASSPGVTLWGIEGNLEDSSIPRGEVVFGNSFSPLFLLPDLKTGPLYGDFAVNAENVSGGLAVLSRRANGSLEVVPLEKPLLVCLASLKGGGAGSQDEISHVDYRVISASTCFTPPSGEFVAYLCPLGVGSFVGVPGPEYGKYQEEVFAPLSYEVVFAQKGLPSGTPWSVTLNGQTESSTTSQMTFEEPAGTYSYSVGPVSGYSSSPSSGSVTVSGSLTQDIAFAPVAPTTYPITFTESGLPSGTPWSLSVNGKSYSETSSSLYVNLTPGSYSWSVSPTVQVSPGVRMVAQIPNGTLSVPSQTSVSISYSAQYLVKVMSSNETRGSASGGGWVQAGVSFDVEAEPSSGYKFEGWSANSSALVISNSSSEKTTVVATGPGTLVAGFVSSSPPPPPPPPPSSKSPVAAADLALAGVAGVVVIALALFVLARRGRKPGDKGPRGQ